MFDYQSNAYKFFVINFVRNDATLNETCVVISIFVYFTWGSWKMGQFQRENAQVVLTHMCKCKKILNNQHRKYFIWNFIK